MTTKTYTFKYSPLKKKSRDIFYIESEYDERVNEFISTHHDEIFEKFAEHGFVFRYVPKYVEYILGDAQLSKNMGSVRK